MTPRLIVFAKAPEAGRVKTRLVPPLTAVQAADLAEAFALDTLATASTVAGVTVELSCSPAGSGAAMEALLARHGLSARLGVQSDGDLGRRMCAALAAALEAGAPAAVVLGSDSPDLPAALLREAFAALTRADAAIGPCPDGGYYLLGLTRPPAPGLLDGIAWSTGGEADATRVRLRAAGYRIAEIASWPDVDTAADLAALAARLEARSGAAPRTAAWLRTQPPGTWSL